MKQSDLKNTFKSIKKIKKTKPGKPSDTDRDDLFLELETSFDLLWTASSNLWQKYNDIKTKTQQLVKTKKNLEQEIANLQDCYEKSTSHQESRSKRKKTREVDLDKVIVRKRLAPIGGSSAGVFSCNVDGFQCVMKEMNIHETSDLSLQAFEAEVTVLRKLPRHPNICRYLFETKDSSSVRLFLSFYDCTLNSIIHIKKTSFMPREIRHMAFEVATGLGFLHSHHIIHRDIKSENVFVEIGRKNEIIKLVLGDFDTALDTRYNIPKNCIGTPHFMAPEVHSSQNEKAYGLSADIYSFGLLLYELITLKLPFADVKVFDLFRVITGGTKLSLPEDFECPLLSSIYERSTALDPAKRPTALSLIDELSFSSPLSSPSQATYHELVIPELEDINSSTLHSKQNVAVRPLNNSAETHNLGNFDVLSEDLIESDESEQPDSAREYSNEVEEGSTPLMSPKTPDLTVSPCPSPPRRLMISRFELEMNHEERNKRWISKNPTFSPLSGSVPKAATASPAQKSVRKNYCSAPGYYSVSSSALLRSVIPPRPTSPTELNDSEEEGGLPSPPSYRSRSPQSDRNTIYPTNLPRFSRHSLIYKPNTFSSLPPSTPSAHTLPTIQQPQSDPPSPTTPPLTSQSTSPCQSPSPSNKVNGEPEVVPMVNEQTQQLKTCEKEGRKLSQSQTLPALPFLKRLSSRGSGVVVGSKTSSGSSLQPNS